MDSTLQSPPAHHWTAEAVRAHAQTSRDRLELEPAELLDALADTIERIGVDSTTIALRCAAPLRRSN